MWCRLLSPSARCPSRQVHRECGRTRRSSWTCARRCERRSRLSISSLASGDHGSLAARCPRRQRQSMLTFIRGRKPKKAQRAGQRSDDGPRRSQVRAVSAIACRRVQIITAARRSLARRGCAGSASARSRARTKLRQAFVGLLQALHPSSRSADDNESSASLSRSDFTRPDHPSSTSTALIVMKLPRLLLIFSPSTCKKPLCIQKFAITLVWKAQRDCAISFS